MLTLQYVHVVINVQFRLLLTGQNGAEQEIDGVQ